MRPLQLIVILFAVAIVTISTAFVIFTNYTYYEVQKIPTDVRVTKSTGFNLDADALHFGAVSSPGRGIRGILITHDYPVAEVQVKTSGKIADWLYTNESLFILQPNITKEVKFEIRIPENVSEGDYYGTVWVFFRKVQ